MRQCHRNGYSNPNSWYVTYFYNKFPILLTDSLEFKDLGLLSSEQYLIFLNMNGTYESTFSPHLSPFFFINIKVCSSMGRIDVHVILSGDPRQLGPVIQSKIAERMGFGNYVL